jgi:hypothetical protein
MADEQHLYQSYFETNREAWNKKTAIHKDSSFYDLKSFKAGRSSLNPIELQEVGEVEGKSDLPNANGFICKQARFGGIPGVLMES